MELSLSWGEPLLAAGGAVLVGMAAGHLLLRFLVALVGRLAPDSQSRIREHIRVPSVAVGPLLFLKLADPHGDWAHALARVAAQCQHVAFIAATAWLVTRLARVFEASLLKRLQVDGLWASTRKQLAWARMTVAGLTGWVALAVILMSFAEIRPAGLSMLALAGAVTLFIGVASWRQMGDVMAGVRVRASGLVRTGDVIVIDGEHVTVEAVALTYAVVRQRTMHRLIVPLARLLERRLERWPRESPYVLGTVTLWVGLDTDVDRLRGLFLDAVHSSELWDRRMATLHVSHCSDDRIEICCEVSAADADRLWDLRCALRERMLSALRDVPTWWPERRAQPLEAGATFPDNPAVTPADVDVHRT